MSNFERFQERMLSEDPEVRAEYEALGPTYDLIADLIRLRLQKGLTQHEVARRMGKQQPAIARFEAGNVKPTVAFLQEVANALDARLVMHLEEKTLPVRNQRAAG